MRYVSTGRLQQQGVRKDPVHSKVLGRTILGVTEQQYTGSTLPL